MELQHREWIRVAIAALVGVVAVLTYMVIELPDHLTIERSRFVQAPPSVVFNLVNGFHRFNQYSPWFDYDPAAKFTTSGPIFGRGARLEWQGADPRVGSGSQEIMASEPNRLVSIMVNFSGVGPGQMTWRVEPRNDGSEVHWGYDAKIGWSPWVRLRATRWAQSSGQDFERGLEKLGALAEARAQKLSSSQHVPVVETVEGQHLISVSVAPGISTQQLRRDQAAGLDKLRAFARQQQVHEVGPPRGITRIEQRQHLDFDVALPIGGTPQAIEAAIAAAPAAGVKVSRSFAGSVVRATHVGGYESLTEAYFGVLDFVKRRGYTIDDRPWASYVDDPAIIPEEEFITEVYVPIKSTPTITVLGRSAR